jgi:branched-chain amino acid transport system ATP-binding protein
VLLHGEDLSHSPAALRTRRGIGRAFQLTNLFPELSVEENVRLAVQARSAAGLNLWSVWSSHREWSMRALEILESVALADKREVLAKTLAHGDQRKLEVALLMALEPDVFMFDEPTAGMSADEVPVILELIRRLKARADKTILLVEHKMDVVRELSDRVVVLHNGCLVADGPPVEVMASDMVREAYLGTGAP